MPVAIRIPYTSGYRKPVYQENGLHPKGTSACFALGRHVGLTASSQ